MDGWLGARKDFFLFFFSLATPLSLSTFGLPFYLINPAFVKESTRN
jgi:hypothetical protein